MGSGLGGEKAGRGSVLVLGVFALGSAIPVDVLAARRTRVLQTWVRGPRRFSVSFLASAYESAFIAKENDLKNKCLGHFQIRLNRFLFFKEFFFFVIVKVSFALLPSLSLSVVGGTKFP